jgi:uncharacterized protein
MPRAILDQTGLRIAQHAERYDLSHVRVVLHGGEPLLAGVNQIDYAARVLRQRLDAGVRLELSIQTNGTLLSEDSLRIMHTHGIRIGVSLDGAEAHHDQHRKYADGRGSYVMTAEAIRQLRKPTHRALFGGLLCTIDLERDPLEVYEALLEFEPPIVDFLLPHGNWSSPPPGRAAGSVAPYADWLGVIFDRWYSASSQETGIRLFEEVIHLLLGGRSRSDQLGLSPVGYLVVDADGSIQLTDALKAAYQGAPETGLNVFENAIDEALNHPAMIAGQLGLAALADQCQQCNLVGVCGGGHYSHRYRKGNGFHNPSVYCPDLIRLIEHIRSRLLTARSA